MTRAEMIAELVTDRFSGFKDGDEAMLETASDTRLAEFRAAVDARKTETASHTRLEAEHRNVAARLKVAEDKIKTSEQPKTADEFIAIAPPEIKALLEAHKAEEDATRASLVSALEGRGVLDKADLEKKSIPELQTLADYARVEVPDFSGRGMPKQRNASQNVVDYAPPDSYAAGIKVLQSQTVKH